jgi:hypothetical protein
MGSSSRLRLQRLVGSRALFRSADTNQDGVLSWKELVAAKLAEANDGPPTQEEFVAECLD